MNILSVILYLILSVKLLSNHKNVILWINYVLQFFLDQYYYFHHLECMFLHICQFSVTYLWKINYIYTYFPVYFRFKSGPHSSSPFFYCFCNPKIIWKIYNENVIYSTLKLTTSILFTSDFHVHSTLTITFIK